MSNILTRENFSNFFKDLSKRGIVASTALIISSYIITKLFITNNFIIALTSAFFVSLTIQAYRHHYDEGFRANWFLFYFLLYILIIQFLSGLINNNLWNSIFLGFVISLAVYLIELIRFRRGTVSIISLILLILILVSNISAIQNITGLNLQAKNINDSSTINSEIYNSCPTAIIPSTGIQEFEIEFKQKEILTKLDGLLDKSIWTVENSFDSCYKGKFKGQYPDKYYCDNMVVSRFEVGNSGVISYRWYTGVSAVWQPQKVSSGSIYSLEGFECDSGRKVMLEKGITNYYVYDSRDGRQIRIAY